MSNGKTIHILHDAGLREEQRRYALLQTANEERPSVMRPKTPLRPAKTFGKGKPSPTGHEAFLKALETSGATITLEKASSGAVIAGTVRHSDKFTVSVLSEGTVRVIFKHDISEFSASPAPDRLSKEA